MKRRDCSLHGAGDGSLHGVGSASLQGVSQAIEDAPAVKDARDDLEFPPFHPPTFGNQLLASKLLGTCLPLFKFLSIERGGMLREVEKDYLEMAKKKKHPGLALPFAVHDPDPDPDLERRKFISNLEKVYSYATLRAEDVLGTDMEILYNCRRLVQEWQGYISRTHRLRDVYATQNEMRYRVKIGFGNEATEIEWSIPHKLAVHELAADAKLAQIHIKRITALLYEEVALRYPPILDPGLEALAAALPGLSMSMDANTIPIIEDDAETVQCKSLFKDVKIFLSSREALFGEELLFVIPAFGGECSWEGEGSPFVISEPTITHQIVDENVQVDTSFPREYVHARWVLDCIHYQFILETEEYRMGRVLPPLPDA